MKRKLIVGFMMFPDIMITFGLFITGLVFTFIHARLWGCWLSAFGGVLVYGVSEYLTHRFVFHMKPPENQLMRRFMKRIHYDHHANPNDLHLLFLPIWYSFPNIMVVSIIFFAFDREWYHTVSFATGILVALLFYEWKHYVAHRPIQPLTSFGRSMKKMHLWHHFKNENFWYGVTHPGMDYLMGTYRDERIVERSHTANDLEHRSEEKHVDM